VIGLTERHRKPDIFWFNLLHEIGHIALHPRRTTFLDLDLDKSIGDTAEQQADVFAESTLLLVMPAPNRSRDQPRRTSPPRCNPRHRSDNRGRQHGHATGQWNIGGPSREITDADISMLEALSPHQDKNPASASARRSRFTRSMTHRKTVNSNGLSNGLDHALL